MIISYGTTDNNIDVTNICLTKLTKNNIITIPSSDLCRAHYFGDPIYGVLKKIIVRMDDNTNEFNHLYSITINLNNKMIIARSEKFVDDKLRNIHSILKINHGLLQDELPEQKMAIRYLTGKEKILELGGNIGRNSLVISSILNDSNNLVVLECDSDIASQLESNKILNNFNFKIENSALSKRKLIQRAWDTKPSNILLEGHKWVNVISFDEIQSKYDIQFDTLVLDCEGAFYYILLDMPEILNNINLIIMENDYWDKDKKKFVDKILSENNFYRDYVEPGGWGPCFDNFFEVWKKDI